MRMTDELEEIMKRRLEQIGEDPSKIINNHKDNHNLAFISHRTVKKKNMEIGSIGPLDMQMKVPNEGMKIGGEDDDKVGNDESHSYHEDDVNDENNGEGSNLISTQHQDLIGRDRLNSIVLCLGESCPWTKTISSIEMLGWLRSELDELQKELDLLDLLNEQQNCDAKDIGTEKRDNDTNDENDNDSDHVDKKELASFLMESLTSEMGDILFDALMLDMIVKREYNIDNNATWNAANEKIERRTPYMKEWGDGKSVATTSEEATDIWLRVKKQETKNTLMQSVLQKFIDEQKEREEKKLMVQKNFKNEGDTEKIEVNEVESNGDDKDETDSDSVKDIETKSNGEVENVLSIEPSDDECQDPVKSYTSDEFILTNDEYNMTSNMHTDEPNREISDLTEQVIEEEDKKQLDPIVEKSDPIPILGKSLMQFTQALGLNNVTNGSQITSATLGFATGALVMALLQKIRLR